MNDWIVWQIADSAFPIGGFAHSGGLEAAWRAGHVRDAQTLQGFVHANLLQTTHGVTPLALMACRDGTALGRADELCDLLLNHPVANRASRAQGRAMISLVRQMYPTRAMDALHEGIGKGVWHGHFAVALGAVGRVLAIDETQVSRLVLFMSMRSIISAAVRLGIVGPLAGQSLQLRLSRAAESLANEAIALSPDDVAQTSPMAELFQGCHDRLYSRLFQS